MCKAASSVLYRELGQGCRVLTAPRCDSITTRLGSVRLVNANPLKTRMPTNASNRTFNSLFCVAPNLSPFRRAVNCQYCPIGFESKRAAGVAS